MRDLFSTIGAVLCFLVIAVVTDLLFSPSHGKDLIDVINAVADVVHAAKSAF